MHNTLRDPYQNLLFIVELIVGGPHFNFDVGVLNAVTADVYKDPMNF